MGLDMKSCVCVYWNSDYMEKYKGIQTEDKEESKGYKYGFKTTDNVLVMHAWELITMGIRTVYY